MEATVALLCCCHNTLHTGVRVYFDPSDGETTCVKTYNPSDVLRSTPKLEIGRIFDLALIHANDVAFDWDCVVSRADPREVFESAFDEGDRVL